MRLVFAFLALVLALPASAQERQPYSIAGVRLGMTEAEVLRALPPDLRESVDSRKSTMVVPHRILIDAGEKVCHWLAPAYKEPCEEFHAILLQVGKDPEFRVVSVTLRQILPTDLVFKDVETALIKAYGAIDAKASSGGPGVLWNDGAGSPWTIGTYIPMFVWSPEFLRLSADKRAKHLSTYPNAGDMGLTLPLLRALFRHDNGVVRAFSLMLADPAAFREHDRILKEHDENERRRREQDALKSLRLR